MGFLAYCSYGDPPNSSPLVIWSWSTWQVQIATFVKRGLIRLELELRWWPHWTMHKCIFWRSLAVWLQPLWPKSPWYIFKSSLMSVKQRFAFLWRLIPIPETPLADAYEGNLAHVEGDYDDVILATEGSVTPAPLRLLMQWRQGRGHWIPWVVVVVEVRSMTLEPLMLLLQRKWGRWRQGHSGHWYSRSGVDDAGAPRAVEVAEAGSMTSEPLRPLLQRRRGWWRRSPPGRCYGGGNDDMLLCWRKLMCATLFGASIYGVSISLQMVERVVSFMAAFSYEGVKLW
jgi:hypothetical protein